MNTNSVWGPTMRYSYASGLVFLIRFSIIPVSSLAVGLEAQHGSSMIRTWVPPKAQGATLLEIFSSTRSLTATNHAVVIVRYSWFVNSTDTIEAFTRNATLFAELFQQWNETQTGPFVDGQGTHIAWLRLPNNSTIFEHHPDPAAGPDTPHFELVTGVGQSQVQSFPFPELMPTRNGMNPLNPPPVGNFISVGVALVTPVGRGSIMLNSTDPFTPPLIDPGLLNTDFEIFAMRTAIRTAQRFLSAPAWKDYVLEPFGGLVNVTTDDQLDEYIRNGAGTTCHPVGTASMSAEDAKYGVVNPDLRVKGVTGLRIVDASVLV